MDELSPAPSARKGAHVDESGLEPVRRCGGCDPSAPSPDRRWQALGFLLASYLLVFAGVTMMNVALPAAQSSLGMSETDRLWVVTIYSLSFGGLMLLGGRVADTIGMRRAVVVGTLAFAAAALAGGLAVNGAMLVTARAAQGAAAAVVAPGVLALLSVMFPHGADRARAFGALGAVMGIGAAGSFVVAGWLTDTWSWRWCLLINVPIAIVATVGLARTAPPETRQRGRRLDVWGAATVTVGVAALMLGTNRAAQEGWQAASTIGLLAIGVLLLAVFAALTRWTSDPLLPPRVIADRVRVSALVATFVLALALFAGLLFVTIYLQVVLEFSALRTGVALLPFGLAAIVVSRVIARIGTRLSGRAGLLAGLVAVGVAMALLPTLTASSGYAVGVVPLLVLLGAGGPLVMVTATNLATAGAGADSGIAGAAVTATQQVGAAVGTALLGSIAAAATVGRYEGSEPTTTNAHWVDALVYGHGTAGAVGAAIIAIGIVVVFLAGRSMKVER